MIPLHRLFGPNSRRVPVSYTHLDVYKRQSQSGSRGPRTLTGAWCTGGALWFGGRVGPERPRPPTARSRASRRITASVEANQIRRFRRTRLDADRGTTVRSSSAGAGLAAVRSRRSRGDVGSDYDQVSRRHLRSEGRATVPRPTLGRAFDRPQVPLLGGCPPHRPTNTTGARLFVPRRVPPSMPVRAASRRPPR